MLNYFKNILIGFDQLANTILAGDPDETISSRIGKRVRSNQATMAERWVAYLLDCIDPDHCQDSIEEDEG